MAKKKTTIYVDDALLKAAKVMAARTGKKEYEIFEDALRGHLGLETLEKIWRRSTLTGKQALDLAYQELHESRKQSRK